MQYACMYITNILLNYKYIIRFIHIITDGWTYTFLYFLFVPTIILFIDEIIIIITFIIY